MLLKSEIVAYMQNKVLENLSKMHFKTIAKRWLGENVGVLVELHIKGCQREMQNKPVSK